MDEPRRLPWRAALLGAVAGILAFGGIRFLAVPADDITHYHANWAVFVDGARLDLGADRYMEDVSACKVNPAHVAPEERVHQHGGDDDAVHVHDLGVTWGHLLANLGFGIGPDYLVTDGGVRYVTDSARSLKFVVNGQRVDDIRNRVIASRDRLLISYGPESVNEVTRTQFPQVASTAERLNREPDPASCSGPSDLTTGQRLRRAFWF